MYLRSDHRPDVPLGDEPLVLGRDAGADVVVDDPRASRRHAEIGAGARGAWILRDLGSSNGTYLNGERLSQGINVRLKAGARIRIGGEEFVVTADASDMAPPDGQPVL